MAADRLLIPLRRRARYFEGFRVRYRGFTRPCQNRAVTDTSGENPAPSSRENRPPVRIAGPAHRRPSVSWVKAWMRGQKTRHIVAWAVLALLVVGVVAQRAVSALSEQNVGKTGNWAGPPPGNWSPGVTRTTVTATPSPSHTKRPQNRPAPVGTPSPEPTHGTPSPTPHKPKSRTPSVRIIAPRAGTKVAGQPGVLMTGTAKNLKGRTLRIFDYAPNGVYYVADNGSVPVSDGLWSFRDATIGDGERDVGTTFELTAVISDKKCQATIHTERDAHNGTAAFQTLPDGCREVASVRVLKTAP